MSMIRIVFIYFPVCGLLFFFMLFVVKKYLQLKRILWKRKNNGLISVGFFHPYCAAGGGGERVLWNSVQAIQKTYEHVHCVIYTGDKMIPGEILDKTESYFSIKLLRPVEFVYLKKRNWIEDQYYPYFTLLLQSIGSVVLGIEALFKHVPDIYVDSMGYAWTYPVFKCLGTCRIAAYVHYPTISTDMLNAVKMRKNAVNNQKFISNSKLFSYFKLIYYKLFALFYGFVGAQAEVIMVNSSWTKNHILDLWKKPECTFVVYPPCDISKFKDYPIEMHVDKKKFVIISIAQFRPEKNHELQINAFHTFLSRVREKRVFATLVLVGSCRHEEDYARVEKLKKMCSELGISRSVEFKLNLTFQEVVSEMKKATVALHTMWNEHFGIGNGNFKLLPPLLRPDTKKDKPSLGVPVLCTVKQNPLLRIYQVAHQPEGPQAHWKVLWNAWQLG